MKFLKHIFIFLAVFTLTFLGIEAYLQVTEIDIAYHELDARNGKKLQKDRRIVMLKEGFYLGRSNAYGYLGHPYPPEKPEGVFRIALMGDSYAEGFQVFEKDHYFRILEEELRRITGKEVQVLNFGSGDFNFQDMYRYYLNFAAEYNPDLVLYALEPERFRDRPAYFIPSPYFYLEGDSLKINYEFTEKPAFQNYNRFKWLMETSSTVKMALNAYKMVSKGHAPRIIFDKFYFMLNPVREKDPLDPSDDVIKEIEISPITQRIINDLGQDERVYLLGRNQFSPSLLQNLENAGLPLIHADDTLKVMVAARRDPHYWKATSKRGHWNHEAHETLGHYLAHRIAPLILQPAPVTIPDTLTVSPDSLAGDSIIAQ
ncbi:MAG: hypothetical protein SF053_03390 [Bacteroidia bacterium]|nr:hypothetical protein [Bacteroidia bacterium]